MRYLPQYDYEIISWMIATLTGKVGEKLQETIVLDVAGVGYGVLVTAEDYGRLKLGSLQKTIYL